MRLDEGEGWVLVHWSGAISPHGSIEDARRAVTLDPLSFQTRSQLAQNLTWGGHQEEARTILREIIEEDPTQYVAHWALGVAVRPIRNDPEAALKHFDDALALVDSAFAHASRSLVLRVLGRTDEADEIIRKLQARTRGPEYMSPFALAVAYAGKGEIDRGVDYLEEGVSQRDPMTLHMRLIGAAFRFEDHPRFKALVREIWPDDVQ